MERISWSEAHARVYELRPPINLPWFVVAHATFHGFQGLEKRTLGGEARENDQIEREWTNDDCIVGARGQDLCDFRFFFLSRILRFFKLSAYFTRFKVKLEEIHITISWLSATFSFPRMNSPCAYKKKKKTNSLESSRSGLIRLINPSIAHYVFKQNIRIYKFFNLSFPLNF